MTANAAEIIAGELGTISSIVEELKKFLNDLNNKTINDNNFHEELAKYTERAKKVIGPLSNSKAENLVSLIQEFVNLVDHKNGYTMEYYAKRINEQVIVFLLSKIRDNII
jgi:predicted Rossmann-fold nucleotide-binding protein